MSKNKEKIKEGVCYSKYATRPILYTDAIGGRQVCRDDMWAVTTEELNSLENSLTQDRVEMWEEMIKKAENLLS